MYFLPVYQDPICFGCPIDIQYNLLSANDDTCNWQYLVGRMAEYYRNIIVLFSLNQSDI